MEEPYAIAAARKFLALIYDGAPPTSRDLLRALDELAVEYHRAPQGKAAGKRAEGQYRSYWESAAILRERFPTYGYYVLSDPTKSTDETGLVSGAIDDLCDIAADLERVIWRFENFGPSDAQWHFRFLFEIHWGVHLRELALYLHVNALRN